MTDKKEPQSYGSQDDWVSGRTDQKVNTHPTDFEESASPHQGGETSPVQSREHTMPSGPPADDGRKVTVAPSGAKRGGYFKERDYEGEK
jgi:hypothetical protein